MSEEFKKEEINGEAAEKTKAAEHTEEVKAETTAEQSAAETEKPQHKIPLFSKLSQFQHNSNVQ